MTRTMHRHEIPVDDSWHHLDQYGPIRHIAARRPDVVEIWVQHDDGLAVPVREKFLVVGTGQPWPQDDSVTTIEWVGTALAPGGLVWHLLRYVDRLPIPYFEPSPAGGEPR